MCRNLGLAWVPLIISILLPFTFLTTYTIAVLLNHVDAEFPYISDTGTKSPESCIFGQLLNIAALLILLCIYIRYKQVQDHNTVDSNVYSDVESRRIHRLNKVTLVLGILAGLGISIVGNFQETNVIYVHILGAMMAFGLGTLYCWIQTCMSYSMTHMTSVWMSHVRIFICVITTLSFISTFTAAYIASSVSGHKATDTHWDPDEPGFVPHVVSTASEWVMAAGILGFFITLIFDFKGLTMTHPEIRYVIITRPMMEDSTNDDVMIS